MPFYRALHLGVGCLAALIAAAGGGFAAPAAGQGGPALLAVQFAPTPGKTEILVTMAAPVSFHAEIGATPGRLDIVFDATTMALGATAGRGFGPVRSYHADAAEPGHTRYEFELTEPVIVSGVHVHPGKRGKPALAVVELAPADPIAMAAASGLTFAPDYSAPPPAPVALAGSSSPEPDGGKGKDRQKRSGPGEPSIKESPTKEISAKVAMAEAAAAPSAALPPPATKVSVVAPPPATPPASSRPAAIAGGKRTIVIDAGHGGIDPGAESIAGYHEKEITLATARVLKRVLEGTGRYRVVLTRDRDTYLKLHERVKRARAAHGDLFVSLHADSIGGSMQPVAERSARGASVYTLSEKATDSESDRLAQRENRADAIGGVNLKGESDDVAGILVDLTVRETVNDGNRFAGMLVNAMEQNGITLFPRLPHRSAGFAVLKAPDIPSVLVEMGYLSDIREARGLADPAYQRRIAVAITQGVDRFFAWVEASRS